MEKSIYYQGNKLATTNSGSHNASGGFKYHATLPDGTSITKVENSNYINGWVVGEGFTDVKAPLDLTKDLKLMTDEYAAAQVK